jgi:hypothetical protein
MPTKTIKTIVDNIDDELGWMMVDGHQPTEKTDQARGMLVRMNPHTFDEIALAIIEIRRATGIDVFERDAFATPEEFIVYIRDFMGLSIEDPMLTRFLGLIYKE